MKHIFTSSLITKVVFTSAFFFVGFAGTGYLSGPPTGQTGAPSETNCTSCHSGSAITSGTNWSNINFSSDIPACGYTAGQTYNITLTHTQGGISRFGFQLTALTPSNTGAGSFTSSTGTITGSSGGRSYINHTSSGTSGSGTVSWTFTWTAPSTGIGTVTFYTAVNSTNSDNTSNGDQIYVKSFQVMQAGGAPSAVITSPSTPVCVGDTVFFSGTGCNNPTGYSWAFGSSAVPSLSTQQAPKVVYLAPGTFNISLVTTNGSGSSTPSQKQITVLARPSSTVTPSGNITLCGNDSVVLSAPSGSGLTYLWTPGNVNTRTLIVKATGSYKVKVTNASGCSSTSADVNVTRRNLPSVTINVPADSICQGDTAVFTGSGAFATYRFLRDTVTMQNGNSPLYKTTVVPGASVFKVIATDSSGCVSPASNGISIKSSIPLAAPVISCGTNSQTTAEFTWAAVAGASGYEVSADTGKTWTAPSSTLSHTLTGLQDGMLVQLMVRALQQGSACSHGTSAVKTCQTQGCPEITFTYTGSRYVCLATDTSVVMHSFNISNITALKYAVNINNAGYSSAQSAQVSVGLGVNQVNVKIADSLNTGCAIADSTIVITGVNSPSSKPTLSFSASFIDTVKEFCDNMPVTLFSGAPSGSHLFTFLRGTQSDTIQSNLSSQFSVAGKYLHHDAARVIVMDTISGCFKISEPVTVKLREAPRAGFTYNVNGYQVAFTDTSSGALQSWGWTFGSAGAVSAAQNPTFTYPGPGIYNVSMKATGTNNCSDSTSEVLQLFTTGIQTADELSKVSLYPNPASQTIMLSGLPATGFVVNIIDMNGRLVSMHQFEEGQNPDESISLTGFAPGPYVLLLASANGARTIRFLKL